MDKFKLETSIQFPFLELDEIVSYSEVKKPSGIAYMILVLINESKDKSSKFATVLSNFGVPESLHYIYADTIYKLINDDILATRDGYFDRSAFNYYSIGDFGFTAKGKKVFAEECIPTGVTKEAKIPLFYDIAMKQLSYAMASDLEGKPLMDSAITDEFVEKFECEKSVEDFINKNKGVKIPIKENGKVVKNELIKKEEIVTKVELQNRKNWVGKYDCALILNGNTLDFEFENKTLDKFFHDFYTGEMVNKFLSYKNKFKFKSSHSEGLKLANFESKLMGIVIPKEIDDILKQKGQLLITKGNYKGNNYFVVESKEGIDICDNCCEFITVDQSDNKCAYIPGIFDFDSKLGTISIPLVLKLKVTSDELKEMLKPYVNDLNLYSEDNFKNLVKISSISKDYESAYKILRGYLNKDPESNIVLLNEIKPIAAMNANIQKEYKELLLSNYEEYLKSVSEDNLDTVLKITNSIPKFLGISAKSVLDTIFAFIKEPKNKIKVFEELVEKGFDKATVLLYVNPVEEVLSVKKAEEKSLVDLINFDNQINNLKLGTHIDDFRNYTFDEESIDRSEYKKNYSTLKSLQSSISYLKSKNESLFNNYDGFMRLFGTINDDFNMVDAALKNPKNIKPELIEKKITSGEYQFVFVNLSAKLEIILKNKFNLSGKLSDMLSDARRSGLIDKATISDLHDFRENRNVYIHPEDRTPNFKTDDLRRWSKEIFELEEEKENESSSNN